MSWLGEFLGLLFAVIGVITYFIGRKQAWREAEKLYGKLTKHGTQMKSELKEEITEDMVNIANAQLRVKDGGKVARRDNKIIGAHERSMSENVDTGENVVVSKKSHRELIENVPLGDSLSVEVTRAQKHFVAENVKKISADIILEESSKKEESQEDDKSLEK